MSMLFNDLSTRLALALDSVHLRQSHKIPVVNGELSQSHLVCIAGWVRTVPAVVFDIDESRNIMTSIASAYESTVTTNPPATPGVMSSLFWIGIICRFVGLRKA